METTFKDTVVFITGATAGIGAACAERFAQAGARLVLTGRRTERLADLQKKLGAGTEVHCITLDVRDREAVEAAVAALPPRFADVSILVNNAGLALGLEPAHKASLDDWETMIDTNCRGLVTVTRALLPGMVERNRGHIINLGSIAGTFPYPGGNTYGATKAFVHQFSQNLKADLLGTNLRITSIEPGMVETELSLVRFGDEEKARKIYAGMQPLVGDDIADVAVWCATRPAHVNIGVVEVMPVAQAFGPTIVSRD